jgi:hypothetical protein
MAPLAPKSNRRRQATRVTEAATARLRRADANGYSRPGGPTGWGTSENGRRGAGLRRSDGGSRPRAGARMHSDGMRKHHLRDKPRVDGRHGGEMGKQATITAGLPMERKRMRCASFEIRSVLRRRTTLGKRGVEPLVRTQRLRYRGCERGHQDCEQSEEIADLLEMATQHAMGMGK